MSECSRPATGVRARWSHLAKSRWSVPVFCLVMGVVVFGAQAAGGEPYGGVVSLVILWAYGLILIVTSKRSETASLLSGEVPDERAASIQLRAGAATGYLLTLVLVGGFLVSLARGSDMTQWWANLCAVGGVGYLAAVTWFRHRS
jgi:hypothetical protein